MKRKIIIDGDVAYVPLTKAHVAIIDAADVDLVDGYSWYAMPNGKTVYARRGELHCGKSRTVFLHRVILGILDPKIQTDHIDRNGLNNRRTNLRVATRSENMRNKGAQRNNKSGFKGVSWNADMRKWEAKINILGRQTRLGMFDAVEAAHAAYREAAEKFHGDFARVE